MEILSSRILIRSADPDETTAFYRDVLKLAVYREFPGGTVFFFGGAFLEVSGRVNEPPSGATQLWLQVRDVDEVAEELEEHIIRPPKTESWGLREAWLLDPDGRSIVLVQVPDDHPLRVDSRR
ncbi:VOC family protein [Lentzea tibetensis]|uniref:VOC family protein n=1 Tax=Lentzea tibetensis TaxID=2591470 RepID=A0A563EGK5_9PSEU|nr:VOC family protein [Lentzea tibetensis]TWP45308.1 VOC family protein [Lentzea tibetensis]